MDLGQRHRATRAVVHFVTFYYSVHMPQELHGFVFDLDGVVVFTDKYHYLGWKKLADQHGWELDESLGHQLRGVSRIPALEVILDHNGVVLSDDEKHRLGDQKNEYYKALLQQINESDIYPGSIGFIKRVRDRGLSTALASASKNAQAVLEALQLTHLFDAVVTGNDITRSKPDPQVFLLAARRLGIAPEHCIVFEDAYSGIEAAKNAGMHAVGVGPVDRLPNAPLCITDYAEIALDDLIERGTAWN